MLPTVFLFHNAIVADSIVSIRHLLFIFKLKVSTFISFRCHLSFPLLAISYLAWQSWFRKTLQFSAHFRADVEGHQELCVNEVHSQEIVVDVKSFHEVVARLYRAARRESSVPETSVEENFEKHVAVVVLKIFANVCISLNCFLELSIRWRQGDSNLHQKSFQFNVNMSEKADFGRIIGKNGEVGGEIQNAFVVIDFQFLDDQFCWWLLDVVSVGK